MTDRDVEATPSDSPTITLHSSWRGLTTAALGLLCLVALAVGITVANGPTLVVVAIDLVVVIAVLVVLFDMPIATTFDADGFTRSTALRRHRLRWKDVQRLERMRQSRMRSGGSKGLVALRSVRPILLVDRTEGFVEHRRLRELVGSDVVESHFGSLDEPKPDQIPTWMGRRARWAPEESVG